MTKAYKTGDGATFQFFLSCGILTAGMLYNIALCYVLPDGCPKFEPLAMLGGAIWCVGNSFVVSIVKTIGAWDDDDDGSGVRDGGGSSGGDGGSGKVVPRGGRDGSPVLPLSLAHGARRPPLIAGLGLGLLIWGLSNMVMVRAAGRRPPHPNPAPFT